MCGFLGWIEPAGITVPLPALDAARDALSHRGPDDGRSRHDHGCYLGFRRLAIVDLSEAGAQPMQSANNRYWIVFNGEIYNFVELRGELEAVGIKFNGHSDTEVLLALFARHGKEMLSRLEGMFALCIYDRQAGRILLARDRCGEKPLYLWEHARGLGFASEMRALRRLPHFPTEIDDESFSDYLHLGFVPGHRCIWRGLRKLPPATFVEYDLAKGRLESPVAYWRVPAAESDRSGATMEEAIARIGTMLDQSVAKRLRADVPLGCFLSGGIDSSLIAESAARQTGGAISALTIKFPEWGEDEEPVAKLSAQKMGIPAKSVALTNLDLAQMGKLAGHFDEPFADASLLPTALVCKAAREQFTVVLSGDGGDEVFGGYENHLRARRFNWVDRVPRGLRRSCSAIAAGFPANSRAERIARKLSRPVGRWGLGAMLYPFENLYRRDGGNGDHARRLCEAYDERLGRTVPGALDEAQRTDLRVYLPDDVLTKTDRMSMWCSLEVRAPFLDHHLVEAGLGLPEEFRVHASTGKYILRTLARQRGLPEAVWAGRKRGFGVPLHRWLFQDHRKRVSEIILDRRRQEDRLHRALDLERLIAAAEKNRALTHAVFRLLCYRWWEEGNV